MDEKISGNMPMLIDKNKIIAGDSDQFDLILSTHFLSENESSKARLNSNEKYRLANCLFSLTKSSNEWMPGKSDWLISTLEEKSGLTLSPIERAEFKFNILALDGFYTTSQLDRPVSELLSQCRYHLLINSLIEKQFLLSTHPLKQLLDFIYDYLLGFDGNMGKSLVPMYQFVERIITEVVSTPWNDIAHFQHLMCKADSELQQLTERFLRVADRMVSAEAGHFNARYASDIVNAFLCSILDSVKLPENVARCLQTEIADELRILIVTKGKESMYWLRLKKLLQTLVDLYQAKATSNKQSAILWEELPDEIANIFAELNIKNPAIEACLDTVKFDFYQRIHDKPLVDLVDVNLLNAWDAKNVSTGTVEDEYIDKVKSFPDGQWFVYRYNDQIQRVYLSLKLVDFNQYLFINLLGQKTTTFDRHEFAYALSQQHFLPLNQNGICVQLYSAAIDQLLKGFYQRYEQQAKTRQQADNATKRQTEDDNYVINNDVIISMPKQAVEAEQGSISVGRDIHPAGESKKTEPQQKPENEPLPPQTSRLKKEAKNEQINPESPIMLDETTVKKSPDVFPDELIKQTRLALDFLSLGARVDYFGLQAEKPVRAKLAVKIAATKRFIFVDFDGTTVLDTNRSELIPLVLKGQVVLLDTDKRFNDILQSIIASSDA